MVRLHTEITIHAEIEIVWDILVDFDSYDRWNPYTTNITLSTQKADEYIGQTFNLDVQLTPKRKIHGRELHLFELNSDEYRLRWGGIQFGIHTDRVQYLEKIDHSTTRFVNYEDFNGFLGHLPIWLFGKGMLQGMKNVCDALKTEAEIEKN